MATLTFSYDTGLVPLSRINDAYANYFGYQSGSETKAQFAQRMVKQQIIDIVKSSESSTAISTAVAGVAPIVLT